MSKPNAPVRIFDGVHWVGVRRPSLRFHGTVETPRGTGYNSYLVMGAEKTALIDTVKDGYLSRSLESVRQIMDPSRLDYVVLLHGEPDHAGALRALTEAAPNAEILCSGPAARCLPHIVNRPLSVRAVQDGETLDLGGRRRLRMLSAPFLHWPDSMFAHEERSGALFTGDAFACHDGAAELLSGKEETDFLAARRAYYDSLMRPFAPYVRKAVAHVREAGLPISALLPAHGPIIGNDPAAMLDLYEAWAREEPYLAGNRLFIGYVSHYGYTRGMAKRLQARALKLGLIPELRDLSECPPEEAKALAEASDAVAIGCPTVNGDAPLPVWNLLMGLPVPVMRGRKYAIFGSYGWSGEAAGLVAARFAALGCKPAGGPVTVCFRPTAADMARMDDLGDEIAAALRGMDA